MKLLLLELGVYLRLHAWEENMISSAFCNGFIAALIMSVLVPFCTHEGAECSVCVSITGRQSMGAIQPWA